MTTLGWADAVKERDGHRCAECGSDDRINAHHITPQALGGSNDIDNGITLCHRCHWARHTGDLAPRAMMMQKRNRPPKKRIFLQLRPDVFELIKSRAMQSRSSVSNYLNRHFAELMTASGALTISADIPTPAPAAKPKRKRAG